MSSITQKMILGTGIVAWIVLIVVLVNKPEKYRYEPNAQYKYYGPPPNLTPLEKSNVLIADCFSDCQAIQRGPGTQTLQECKNECKKTYAVGGIGYNTFMG